MLGRLPRAAPAQLAPAGLETPARSLPGRWEDGLQRKDLDGKTDTESNESSEKNVLGVKPDMPQRWRQLRKADVGARLGRHYHRLPYYRRTPIRKYFNEWLESAQTTPSQRTAFFGPRY